MTKLLKVGDESFEYPEQGDLNWGETQTDWATKVSDVLANIVGPQDILLREAPLSNNQITPADVIGLKFDSSKVQQVIVEGLMTRTYSFLSYANFASFPITGILNSIYLDQATGTDYIWNGSAYIVTSSPKVQSFKAEGVYDGANFHITLEYSGNSDCGITLSILSNGQFQYTSTNEDNTDTISIKFRGQAISDT